MMHRVHSSRAGAGWTVVASLLLASGGSVAGERLALARDGEPLASIVLARDATAAERTAAEELSLYLTRATGAAFPVYDEGHAPPLAAEICVGPTAAAHELGLEAGGLGPEEWVIAGRPGQLVLVGGRPRGTLYAVYRFLEDELGVRWWNPFEETVPRNPRLSVPTHRRRGQPVFLFRDVSTIRGPREFCARNRLNGHLTRLPESLGGREAYGPPFFVHTFYRRVSPDDLFEAHPEFFSEIGGVRYGGEAQFCLTNAELAALVAERIASEVVTSRLDATRDGEAPPRLFDLSTNDWGRRCACPACAALEEREGGHSGPLITFVNDVAARISESYPDVLIDTLAYSFTFDPPRSVRPAANVIVRLSGLYERDFSKPIGHPVNTTYRTALSSWAQIATHLRVWDYTVTFGDAGDLPLPNLEFLEADYRTYAAEGVEGLLVQHEFPIAADMRDLKLWVIAKLLEDPHRDGARLIREFTDGYYGEAGRAIRKYRRTLREAAGRREARIGFAPTGADFVYLDLRFILHAQALFERALGTVRASPTHARRVRHARLALDRATIVRWDALVREAVATARTEQLPDLAKVGARYRAAWFEQIALRLPGKRQAAAREEVEVDLGELLARARSFTLSRGRRYNPRSVPISPGSWSVRSPVATPSGQPSAASWSDR